MTDKEKQEKALAKEKKAKEKLDKRLAKIAAKKKKSGKVTVEKTQPVDWSEQPQPTSEGQSAEQPVQGTQPSEKEEQISKRKKKKELKKNLYDKKDIKDKKKKEKHNYKLAFKEFPVKMVKEVSKIKWSDKKNLVTKFVEVVIFMLTNAVFFFLIDLLFKVIFQAAKVIS